MSFMSLALQGGAFLHICKIRAKKAKSLQSQRHETTNNDTKVYKISIHYKQRIGYTSSYSCLYIQTDAYMNMLFVILYEKLQQFSQERKNYPSVVIFAPSCCSLSRRSFIGRTLPARTSKVLLKLLQAFHFILYTTC
jgi:hypothetical protein